jgi:putative hydrolase of the HAD superfamily
MRFSAVAFDLDGTLYPDYSLNLRLIPFVLKNIRLLRAMGKARKLLRESGGKTEGSTEGSIGDFYEHQARLMGEILGMSAEKAREMTERLIYRGWEPLFKEIRLFPHVRETLETFQQKGIKLGLLSDFPPEIKLGYLNIRDFWQVVLSSEETGCLKPAPAPFLELARRMDTSPEQILYVGNRIPYDVEGARKAGMKAALILPRWKKCLLPGVLASSADFSFYDYRQLCEYVVN